MYPQRWIAYITWVSTTVWIVYQNRTGEIYSFANKNKEAIKYYQEGTKHHPQMLEFHHRWEIIHTISHNSLGKALYDNGNYQDAIQSFETAINIAKTKQPSMLPSLQVRGLFIHWREQLGLGKSMYKTTTHRSAGASIVQKLFQENEDNADVLLEFAKVKRIDM